MTGARTMTRPRQIAAAGLIVVFLLMSFVLPAGAQVQVFQNAFNPRGYYVTLKSDPQHPQWLRSPFNSGFYRGGSDTGGGGDGSGGGGSDRKDELGHSNITYTGTEAGIDYIDAADVDTIYAKFDHGPALSRAFLIGYFKDEQSAQLQAIPDFTSYVDTNPQRPSPADPSGDTWWSFPIHLSLGEQQEDGTTAALADGTVYEFAFLRGCQANNGTTCVLMPGDEDGTYKGYVNTKEPYSDEERAEYEAHKNDEYEFITQIDPAGTSSDNTVDHTIQSVPMRYRIQTYADLKSWNEAPEKKDAEAFLASVTEADYSSGKYDRDNVAALQNTLTELQQEADESVKYQLQKDAEYSIRQMLEDLKTALETAKTNDPKVNFTNYNTALSGAETIYNDLKDKTGAEIDQYRAEPVNALKQAIDHAKSTINDSSTQVQVDAETKALNEASQNALDAVIRPEEVTFTDSATGIIVTVPYGAIPSNARLAVREIVSGTTEYNEMVARVSPAPDAVAIYRILFFDGDNVVTPTQPVTVQIPLQDKFEATAPQVYYLDDTGSPGTIVNASSPAGHRVFETQKMGTFVLAGKKQTTPDAQNDPGGSDDRNDSSQNAVHRTTTTTARATRRTTRILRTTRDNKNTQNRQNEITSTSVRRTQAAEPTTMTTTRPPTTQPEDTSDLEKDADQHTMLFIALAIAAVGIGTGGYQLVKDQREKNNEDDVQL